MKIFEARLAYRALVHWATIRAEALLSLILLPHFRGGMWLAASCGNECDSVQFVDLFHPAGSLYKLSSTCMVDHFPISYFNVDTQIA